MKNYPKRIRPSSMQDFPIFKGIAEDRIPAFFRTLAFSNRSFQPDPRHQHTPLLTKTAPACYASIREVGLLAGVHVAPSASLRFAGLR